MLDGFGRAITASCRYYKPASVLDLEAIMQRARRETLTVTFRGNGRSYGDAALNSHGIVVDTSGLKQILEWNASTGIIRAEVGVTIEQLWQHVIGDGYWPFVVPGTMHATLGGCVAMNVHGKNNSRMGPFGDYIEALTLLLADGRRVVLSRNEQAYLFFATIGGLGLLGAIVDVTLRLRKIESGRLRVQSEVAPNLQETLARFERRLQSCDYAVGWVDAYATGNKLGRSELHFASYLTRAEDREGEQSLRISAQSLPTRLFGLPAEELFRFMRPFASSVAMSLLNATKYGVARVRSGHVSLQSHAAFAFLLDYIPDWRLAYGDGGFIQHQLFVPKHAAEACLKSVLLTCQGAQLVPHLAVLKRHREDKYLLSHALDGWSLALDFRVTNANREKVWALTARLTELVLASGGKFYLAKDAVLRPEDAEQAFGKSNVFGFLALKQQLDPTGLFSSDLFERVFPVLSRATGETVHRASDGT